MNATANGLPIHICFIAPKAYPLFNPDVKEVTGGSEVDLYFLATELAKDNNFKVSFIVADYGQPNIEKHEGITIVKSLDFRKNALNGAFSLWSSLKNVDADIYMLKTVSLGVPLLALFCMLHKKLFCYRTSSSPECNGTYQHSNFLVVKLFNRALRRATTVFTQNQGDKENLRKTLGISAILIPNGHRLPPLQQYQRDSILWVGRSDWLKNPSVFIELAKELPDEKFVMICQKATGDKKYNDLVNKAQKVQNLQFIEQVEFDKIDCYFQQAKVFVNTSVAEGFPNTFIQACKWATPILSLNVNPDDFLNRYNCGIYCNNDTTKLSEFLRNMLKEKTFIQMGKNARKYVEGNHDINKIIECYKQIFADLLRKGKPE